MLILQPECGRVTVGLGFLRQTGSFESAIWWTWPSKFSEATEAFPAEVSHPIVSVQTWRS